MQPTISSVFSRERNIKRLKFFTDVKFIKPIQMTWHDSKANPSKHFTQNEYEESTIYYNFTNIDILMCSSDGTTNILRMEEPSTLYNGKIIVLKRKTFKNKESYLWYKEWWEETQKLNDRLTTSELNIANLTVNSKIGQYYYIDIPYAVDFTPAIGTNDGLHNKDLDKIFIPINLIDLRWCFNRSIDKHFLRFNGSQSDALREDVQRFVDNYVKEEKLDQLKDKNNLELVFSKISEKYLEAFQLNYDIGKVKGLFTEAQREDSLSQNSWLANVNNGYHFESIKILDRSKKLPYLYYKSRGSIKGIVPITNEDSGNPDGLYIDVKQNGNFVEQFQYLFEDKDLDTLLKELEEFGFYENQSDLNSKEIKTKDEKINQLENKIKEYQEKENITKSNLEQIKLDHQRQIDALERKYVKKIDELDSKLNEAYTEDTKKDREHKEKMRILETKHVEKKSFWDVVLKVLGAIGGIGSAVVGIWKIIDYARA